MGCKGLHCPGCGDGAGSGLGAIICVIVGLILAGGAVKIATAADKILTAIEHIVIIAGISIGALSLATLAGICTVRLRRRSVSRARVREPLYRARAVPAVHASREPLELPASSRLRALPPAESVRARVLKLRVSLPDEHEPRR
jgi:hypothetical protein